MGKVKLKIRLKWKENKITKWFYIESKVTKAQNNKIRRKTFELGVILETVWGLIRQIIFNAKWFFLTFYLKNYFDPISLALSDDFSFNSEDYNHAKNF